MRTLVAYGTKYGTAAECAAKIAALLPGEVVVADLSKEQPDPETFDRVILGGAVYVGQVRKEVRAFGDRYEAVLLKKPLGLFLCGMSEEKAEEEMAASFSPDLRGHAGAAAFLGGVFRYQRMHFMERALVKMISKKDPKVQAAGFEADYHAVDEEALRRFAQAMKGE